MYYSLNAKATVGGRSKGNVPLEHEDCRSQCLVIACSRARNELDSIPSRSEMQATETGPSETMRDESEVSGVYKLGRTPRKLNTKLLSGIGDLGDHPNFCRMVTTDTFLGCNTAGA
jgi:hypothetical protein